MAAAVFLFYFSSDANPVLAGLALISVFLFLVFLLVCSVFGAFGVVLVVAFALALAVSSCLSY